jgi:outer membrane protein TolC
MLILPCVVTGQDLEVTLDQAIERARAVQPALVEAEELAERRRQPLGLGAFLPSLSTSASATRGNVGRVTATRDKWCPGGHHTVGSALAWISSTDFAGWPRGRRPPPR